MSELRFQGPGNKTKNKVPTLQRGDELERFDEDWRVKREG